LTSLKALAKNPWTTIVALGVGILGTGATIFTLVEAWPRRNLVYGVVTGIGECRDSRSVHGVANGKLSASSMLVVFSNQGNRPVKSSDLLGLSLRSSPPSSIRDVRLWQTDQVGLEVKVSKDDKEQGLASLSWNILEEGKSLSLIVSFCQDHPTRLAVQGTSEGQARIRRLPVSFDLQRRRHTRHSVALWLIGIGAIPLVACLCRWSLTGMSMTVSLGRKPFVLVNRGSIDWTGDKMWWITLGLSLLLLSAGLLLETVL